ncbi:type II toxin-antitoxin system Phd/YefM family antitoxin [Thalassospira sp. TSL5-1]|uniref:type II toxin-antitoxin system Phd/YefM family antitoxin n=1 Tax=Thalassospira sp. TSL5-1 TaxID=1544451 RepID=UPI00093B37B7|nr:type II toxin-antitoxin system Phd/YefM family antitoxin [Thalassospira sp. TSL5-1]OKH88956.1 hypothetical protein LF95_02485 [Thalassospira sp. TSL5-1]
MTRITATEFEKDISTFSNTAISEPVIITNQNRDHLVLISAEEYHRLTGKDQHRDDDFQDLVHRRANHHKDTLVELAKR